MSRPRCIVSRASRRVSLQVLDGRGLVDDAAFARLPSQVLDACAKTAAEGTVVLLMERLGYEVLGDDLDAHPLAKGGRHGEG